MLWSGVGRDVLPGPIQHHPTAATQEEYRREIDIAAKAVAAQMTDNLYSALVAMVLPDTRVNVYGYVGTNAERKIRIHAVVRERVGVLVVQATNGVVYLDRIGAARLPEGVVRALPRFGPGRHATMRARLADLREKSDDEHYASMSILNQVSAKPSPSKQLRQFMRRPRIAFGHIVVNPGPAVDNRPVAGGLDCYFADYADDGRYLVRKDTASMEIDPVDPARLTAVVQRLVDAVHRR